MKNIRNLILINIILSLFFSNSSYANFQEKLINKYEKVDSLYFDFTQKIGDKVDFGYCYIEYPLLMKCDYPKKSKSIISNGKKFAIVKKRYKKIYYYPLKKTPLFYILNKKNILNIIKNNKPTQTNSNLIQYEFSDDSMNKINIFFDKKSLNFSGWKTKDAYSNDVYFLIRNVKTNIEIEKKKFIIPSEEDL